MTIFKITLPLVLLGLAPIGANSQHEDHEPALDVTGEQIGDVNFTVSCNPDAQQEFNRAMALFHSFWFQPAKSSFARVLEQDSECGMAHWGMSIMSMGNPFAWPAGRDALEAAEIASTAARSVGAGSQREREYIAALATYFERRDTTAHQTRAVAFVEAMADLAARYPTDDEARILHALLLIATAVPSDKTFANQLRAGEILEPLSAKYPDHPGIAHYLIHAYDSSELAERGLAAARAYAGIAPAVPHALHMPSHVFSRIGLWAEMVESNQASYLAAKGELEDTTFEIGTYDALHAMDYLVFAHLQQAQDKAAKTYVDEVAAMRAVTVENFIAAYALAAIPSRYALERGDWEQAAALRLSPPDLLWSQFPQAEAILVFARGLGAARMGDSTTARQDRERLETLAEAMRASGNAYWAGQTNIQVMTVSAWTALAENRQEEALQLMRAAADAEDSSDKHPVTPGNVAPSRELLAEMLMSADVPAQAFVEYERSLQRDPNRLRSVHGAARAAQASGNSDAALRYCIEVDRLIATRDTDRAGC